MGWTMSSTDPQHFQQAIRYFITGQVGFFLLLLLCIVMIPEGVTENRGFSFYGDNGYTVVPYSLALLISAVFILLSAGRLPDGPPFRLIKFSLRVTVPLLGLIVISTYSLAPLVIALHIGFGVALFVVQLLFAGWLGFFVCRDRRNYLLLTLLFGGGLVSLLSLTHVITYLIWGQIGYQLAFGFLVVHTLKMLRA